ncbi:hypothetical protein XENORESO_012405, partial [Xenotaenia resolanae]
AVPTCLRTLPGLPLPKALTVPSCLDHQETKVPVNLVSNQSIPDCGVFPNLASALDGGEPPRITHQTKPIQLVNSVGCSSRRRAGRSRRGGPQQTIRCAG